MPRSIYRSEDGQTAIRSWCLGRIQSGDLETREIESPLGKTHVTMVGEGADVVLLPGTNFATATWLGLLIRLGREHRVVGLDLPGQPGLSAKYRPRDPRAYGRWLRTVVSELGLDHPVVAGHSLGGRVALLAASGDTTVGALVLVDPAGLIRLRVPLRVLVATLRWLGRRNVASSDGLLRTMTGPDSEVTRALAVWMTLVARHVKTSLAPPPLPEHILRKVRCPVWLLTGRHDPFLSPQRLLDTVTTIAGPTEASVVLDAGHLLPEETPDRVAVAIRQAVAARST